MRQCGWIRLRIMGGVLRTPDLTLYCFRTVLAEIQ